MAGILADFAGFGRIYECWDCPNIHLQVGPVNITLARGAYMQLVDLVNTSAANFELLRHRDQTIDQTSSQPQRRIDGSDGPLRE